MHNKNRKILIMLTALILLLGLTVPATLAYMSVKTEPVMNTFVPVKTPDHDFDITIVGEKELSGRDWQEGDAYSFEVQIWDVNIWKTIGTESVAYDKENNDFNKFDCSNIIKGQVVEEGEYSFRIAETEGSDETITYDSTACRFDLKVVADETGAMDIVEVTDAESTEVVLDEETGDYTVSMKFTNKYTAPITPPEPVDPDPVKLDFVVDKTVKNIGDKTIGPKGFDFKLVKNSTKEEWTREVNEDGYAAFVMTYTKDDIGKVYLYELSEINDGIEGVTYSDKVYDIAVGIQLNEDNELVADLKVDEKDVRAVKVKFENTYDGESGEMEDESDPTLPEEPTEPTDPSDPSEPTDPSKPTDPTKPTNPKDDGSKTGDDFNMIPVIAIMFASLAVMVAVLTGNRRRKNS